MVPSRSLRRISPGREIPSTYFEEASHLLVTSDAFRDNDMESIDISMELNLLSRPNEAPRTTADARPISLWYRIPSIILFVFWCLAATQTCTTITAIFFSDSTSSIRLLAAKHTPLGLLPGWVYLGIVLSTTDSTLFMASAVVLLRCNWLKRKQDDVSCYRFWECVALAILLCARIILTVSAVLEHLSRGELSQRWMDVTLAVAGAAWFDVGAAYLFCFLDYEGDRK
ncbi:hypothetical protein K432DRAFT_406844 [Lepidopterella palustris CBS 459.81]|uniref:Uncharacterized protein n=1 Tax=Lepidopterella palustris CBS 459.81 TaxID=1314670 RepID=A0A8E2JD41_9PEZI|nr:hypothetical protein K432DRAFT_406844 [Lepidopterella palustris CBS 459.81]